MLKPIGLCAIGSPGIIGKRNKATLETAGEKSSLQDPTCMVLSDVRDVNLPALRSRRVGVSVGIITQEENRFGVKELLELTHPRNFS